MTSYSPGTDDHFTLIFFKYYDHESIPSLVVALKYITQEYIYDCYKWN